MEPEQTKQTLRLWADRAEEEGSSVLREFCVREVRELQLLSL